MNTDLMFSSESNEWATPQDFFDKLNEEFNFTLDPCATDDNHKCQKYYTIKDDGLIQDWSGETVFVNPPYGRQIKDWVKKCSEEFEKDNTNIVLLIPSRTETSYYFDYIYNNALAICFIKGRLKFGGCSNSAPFPSALIIYADRLNKDQESVLNTIGKLVYI